MKFALPTLLALAAAVSLGSAGPSLARPHHHHSAASAHRHHGHASRRARGRHPARHRRLASNDERGSARARREKIEAIGHRHAALCDTVMIHRHWRTSCRGEKES